MFLRSTAELIKNTSTISPTTLPTVKDALDNLGSRTPTSLPVPISEGGTGQTTAVTAFDALSPLTMLGDILSNDGTNDVRVAVGAANTFLGSTGAAVPSYRTAAQVLTSLGYEVGTFTPTMAFATPGTSTWAYATQTGIYWKFGTLVWVFINLNATPTIGTGTGAVRIDGLPFTPNLANVTLVSAGWNANWTWPASRTMVSGFTTSGQTYLQLAGYGTGLAASVFQAASMADGLAHSVILNGDYRVA